MIAEILNFIGILAVCALAGGTGLLFVFLFALPGMWGMERDSRYQELESEISERQMKRDREMIELLLMIRDTGEDERDPLWIEFKRMDAENEQLCKEERRQLVDAQMDW